MIFNLHFRFVINLELMMLIKDKDIIKDNVCFWSQPLLVYQINGLLPPSLNAETALSLHVRGKKATTQKLGRVSRLKCT